MDKEMNIRRIAGYCVTEWGTLLDAPCGCDRCSEDGWQVGHIFCDNVPPPLLEAEERGEIRRDCNSSWKWVVIE